MRYLVVALLLATTSVQAKDFTVNDRNHANIDGLCAVAVKSPNISMEVTSRIRVMVLSWDQRMKAAEQPPPPPEKTPEKPKSK